MDNAQSVYSRCQELLLKDEGIEVGSFVRVNRKASSRECGWGNDWDNAKDSWVNSGVYKVSEIDSEYGIKLERKDGIRYWFPFFVIEKADISKEPLYEFKPFERVLVRDREDHPWRIDFFSYVDTAESFSFKCLHDFYNYCIPYEGHEEFVNTVKTPEDASNYYRSEGD